MSPAHGLVRNHTVERLHAGLRRILEHDVVQALIERGLGLCVALFGFAVFGDVRQWVVLHDGLQCALDLAAELRAARELLHA